MAEMTVAATPATTGYVDPKKGVWGQVPNLRQNSSGVAQTITNNVITDVTNHIADRSNLKLSVFYVSSVENTNTWTSEIKNAVACAWQPEDATDDDVRIAITAVGTASGERSRGGSVFTAVAGGTRSGWLWVLHSE
jgi:hypothetical protein